MSYFLFSDSTNWHREIIATTWREAIRKAREEFSICGRIRATAFNYDTRDYRLDGTTYTFTLRQVN
jgi:hypothetical protein